MDKIDEKIAFPSGFLFGTATAAHQIEGNNIYNDWWHWEQSGKLLVKSEKACRGWTLWKDDINLAKSLGNNAYRFSIEWSRIEPQEGKFNLSALKHYEQEIKYLHKLKMKAMLTLWHFTLPQWFSDKGGFTKKENAWYFSRYVNYVLYNLAEVPDYWITLNEPSNVYVGGGYLYGVCPPGKKSLWVTLRVLFNLIKPHKIAYKLIHQKYSQAEVGVALNMICFENFNKNPLLNMLSWIEDKFCNRLFLDSILNDLDFIGVNYYYVHRTGWQDLLPQKLTRKIIKDIQLGKNIGIGGPIYPQGIYKIVTGLKKYNLPIIITENGLADDKDNYRKNFINNTLAWLWQAIKEGADVRGYFYWTLMDNFEWTSGYEPKYGLCSVDKKTFKRNPRESAKYYAEICKTGVLNLDQG